MSQNTIRFSVMRYRPETDEKPHFEQFDVPYLHETSILDGLNYIRDNLAPDLSYRSSCRMAVCGSCSMMINGVPKLACKTFIRDYASSKSITIEPLENFPIERDLVVDISDMITKIESIKPYIVPAQKLDESTPNKQTPQQLEKYRQFAQCINCGCCYAACPQYKLNPEFIGPAALTLLYRYNHDNRDGNQAERNEIMSQQRGVWGCTSVGYCSNVCPKLADPASAVQLNKEESAFDYIRHFFRKNKS